MPGSSRRALLRTRRARVRPRYHRGQCPRQGEIRRSQAEHRRNGGEHERFGEQLHHDPAPGGTRHAARESPAHASRLEQTSTARRCRRPPRERRAEGVERMNARPDKNFFRDLDEDSAYGSTCGCRFSYCFGNCPRAKPECRQLRLSLRELDASRQTAEYAQRTARDLAPAAARARGADRRGFAGQGTRIPLADRRPPTASSRATNGSLGVRHWNNMNGGTVG